MSDRAMSLERSPPRARFETVHPETPEQTSATHPAVTMDEATQQNPPQVGGGVGQDPSSDRPEQATPPKRDEEVEDADAAETFVAEYDVDPEEDARGGAADRATNHDASRDSENLAFRDGGAHPYVEDQSMGESEDERSDSDSDSASDSDDDRTDEDDDALIDVWDGDPPLGNLDPSYLDLGSFSRELVRAPRPSAGFLELPRPEGARARCIRARGPRLARIIARVHRAPRASSSRARTPRARPAQRPPPPLRIPSEPPRCTARAVPSPERASGFDFRLSFWRGFFPLEPDAETNPPHPRRRRAVSRRG